MKLGRSFQNVCNIYSILQVMLCTGFVCFLVGGLMFGIAFFLFFCGTYVGHWVCLFLGWVTYV